MVNDLVAQFLKMKECDYLCSTCKYNVEEYPVLVSYCKKRERVEGDHITECSSFKRVGKH